ncbi:MAG: LysR family transcriptional regulator [Rhizobiaceae bacterium]|nr:LysR family transcriptional regulator [Rhizobiaceae bacterium]
MDALDPDLLRTFLAFADTGSLVRAAEIVGRSPSAVTVQMQRLESVVGAPLLEPSGRNRILTRTGTELAGHARRILDVHRQAILSLKGSYAAGEIAVGATQDFAEAGLPQLLRLFAKTHPRVRLDLRIGRSRDLVERYEAGEIDVLLVMRSGGAPDEIGLLVEPMVWFVSADGLVSEEDVIALALLDSPCEFRNAALAALDAAGKPYRIAATSQSLSGLRAAVGAGLAVTLRTARWAGTGIVATSEAMRLPKAGDAVFSIRLGAEAPATARDLADMLRDGLRASS